MFDASIDKIFVTDIETTGLDSFRNEILTMSISCVALDGFRELGKELFSFKPIYKKFFTSESEAIHGISWEKSQSFNRKSDEWKRFFDFLKSQTNKPIPLVCHAMWFGKYFDSSFIDCQLSLSDQLFEKRKYIGKPASTLTMARNLSKRGLLSVPSNGLAELSRIHNIELKHHDAESDREACQKLFKIFYNKGAIDEYTYDTYDEVQFDDKKKSSSKVSKTKKSISKSDNRFTLS